MSTENPILDALDVSVVVDRKDKPGQKGRTEWRVPIVTEGGTPGAIPITTNTGQLDPSLIPGTTSSAIVTTLTAEEVINAFQVVSVHSDGGAYLADVTDLQDTSQTIGIAITSAVNPGDPVQVQQLGFLSNLGWNWTTPGQTLYLSTGGSMTTTVPQSPAAAFELPIGTVLSNTQIEVQIGLPIVLS